MPNAIDPVRLVHLAPDLSDEAALVLALVTRALSTLR